MHIAAADSTSVNGNVDVTVAEWLELELLLLEVLPLLVVGDYKALAVDQSARAG